MFVLLICYIKGIGITEYTVYIISEFNSRLYNNLYNKVVICLYIVDIA